MNCKIVKSFVLWQKIQPTTGLTWMTFYESWVFRFRCSTGTNKKRLTGGFNVLFNIDQRCWIFKTSLAFQLNDVSQFCRLFFCSQVCRPLQWCSVTDWFNFVLRCDQKYWIRFPTLFNIAQHRNNVDWVWPSHKVCKRKTQRAWANKIRAQPGFEG